MKVRLVLAIFLSIGVLSLPVLAKDVTIGDFALKYANALNLKVSNPSDAVRALAAKGLMGSDTDVSSPLTEAALAEIFERAGLNASTSNPGDKVSENTVSSAISSLAGSVNTNLPGGGNSSPMGSSGGDDEANNNGKKTRPFGQEPNSRANPNAFYGREDEG
ncbi:MAG: hypothetical protein AB1756_08545 [Acidobacteriota bacterium]